MLGFGKVSKLLRLTPFEVISKACVREASSSAKLLASWIRRFILFSERMSSSLILSYDVLFLLGTTFIALLPFLCTFLVVT